MSGAWDNVPADVREMVQELQYCKLFPATTAEQYAELPARRVLWMLNIDNVIERIKASRG